MLHKITLTGLDARTDVQWLPKSCELAVLYTCRPRGRTRYPSRKTAWRILSELRHRLTALHVCGREARQQLENYEIPELTHLVQRIQVNGTVSEKLLIDLCEIYTDHTIITQATENNHDLIDLELPNHSILVDNSGGRGITPETWSRPDTVKPVGFAGGLGPDNLATELPRIGDLLQGDHWWIDMESKLRDDSGWFSTDRAIIAVQQIMAYEA